MQEHLLRPRGEVDENDIDDEEFLQECEDVVFEIVDEEDREIDGNRFD